MSKKYSYPFYIVSYYTKWVTTFWTLYYHIHLKTEKDTLKRLTTILPL